MDYIKYRKNKWKQSRFFDSKKKNINIGFNWILMFLVWKKNWILDFSS